MADTYKSFAVGTEAVAGAGGLKSMLSSVATLVADGATPTQAHVNTHNTNVQAFAGYTSAAVFVNVDTTRVTTVSALAVMLNQILAQAAASGMAP